QRFLKEVHVWSKLDHPNVLPLLGVTTDFDLTVSIVSPWMRRGNARKYVQDKAVDPRPLMAGVAKGLHYLHTHKPSPVFHGDLKGVNILISDTGNALLADFGFSLIVNSSFSMSIHSDGGAKGTVNWMAPEMVNGQNASAEADVWAFGMTVLELFTSKIPFYYLHTLQSVMCAIVGERLPDRPNNEETHSRMTDMWWKICSHCWSYYPSSRPKMAMVVGWITEEVGSSLAAIFYVTYRSLQMKESCSSVPNGTFQVNGSGRRYYPIH
ncbi:kinase-like domain-containing protein, partial [Scleroderma yunnanense]